MQTIRHWIGGRAAEAPSGRTAAVYDPARGTQVAEVALASATEVADALKVAREAAPTWGESSLSRRVAAMFRLRELLDQHRDGLAALVTREHGKVRTDALGEVARGIECVEYACGIPQLLKGSISAEVSFLPRAHGSSLFTRGETQALVAATLGTKQDEQKIESLEGESTKPFMLHYNFPSFSVGEIRRFGSPGHFALASLVLTLRVSVPAVLPPAPMLAQRPIADSELPFVGSEHCLRRYHIDRAAAAARW